MRKLEYGDHLYVGKKSIYVGTIPVTSVLFDLLSHKEIVKWWQGTDALTMRRFPPGKSKLKVLFHRIKMKLLSPFISENWYVSSRLYDLHPQKNAKVKYLDDTLLRPGTD